MRNVLPSTAVFVLAASLVAGGTAIAQTTKSSDSGNASRAGWMSVGAITAKLEGQGYKVRQVEIDNGAYEVEVIDGNGMRAEAQLDPSTGELLGGWKQDD